MTSTRTPKICNHARLVGSDGGDCELCIEREVIRRFFRMLPGQTPEPERRLFTPFPKVHSHRGHAEQIGKYGGTGSRKYEKKRANRLRRRAERLDPENAPVRLIRGWND